MTWIWIAFGGALGTLSRYGLAGLVQRWSGGLFPWGTVAVNLLGSLLFGLIWSAAEQRIQVTPEVRMMILTGFMGAFTTFSTFMFETGQLLREGEFWLALGNLGLQNTMGLLALFLGLAIGKWI